MPTNLRPTDEQIEVRAAEIAKIFYGSATEYPELMSKSWAISLMSAIEVALRTTRDEAGREREDEVRRLREALAEYGEHDKDCILSAWHGGRPKPDGGYECLYGYGEDKKWYDSNELPKCNCGFDQALLEKGR